MTHEKAIERIKDFGLYHAIGDLPYSARTVEAFEMAIGALEKQIPKKAKAIERKYCCEYECPYCGFVFDRTMHFCLSCGQAIDWSE